MDRGRVNDVAQRALLHSASHHWPDQHRHSAHTNLTPSSSLRSCHALITGASSTSTSDVQTEQSHIGPVLVAARWLTTASRLCKVGDDRTGEEVEHQVAAKEEGGATAEMGAEATRAVEVTVVAEAEAVGTVELKRAAVTDTTDGTSRSKVTVR